MYVWIEKYEIFVLTKRKKVIHKSSNQWYLHIKYEFKFVKI